MMRNFYKWFKDKKILHCVKNSKNSENTEKITNDNIVTKYLFVFWLILWSETQYTCNFMQEILNVCQKFFLITHMCTCGFYAYSLIKFVIRNQLAEISNYTWNG